jgi:hypothetical protein
MKYSAIKSILHSSFFIEFCQAKFLWASRFAAACLRFAQHLLARVGLCPSGLLRGRYITRAAFHAVAGGFASIPLALRVPRIKYFRSLS